MKLFKRRVEETDIDPRTKIERDFEEKGQKIGRKTGKVVQKSVDKFHKVKTKLEQDGTMDKIRHFGDKVDDTIDTVVDKVAKKSKAIARKSKHKTKKDATEDDLFYE